MKLAALVAVTLALAVPASAQQNKVITLTPTASTQSSLMIGTLGTSSTVSVATLLTLSAASATQSTGHTK